MNAKKHDCFPKDKSYSKFELNLDLIKLKYLEEIDEKKNYNCTYYTLCNNSFINFLLN